MSEKPDNKDMQDLQLKNAAVDSMEAAEQMAEGNVPTGATSEIPMDALADLLETRGNDAPVSADVPAGVEPGHTSEPEDYPLPAGLAATIPADEAAAEKPSVAEKSSKPEKTAEQLAWDAARKADFNKYVWQPWLWPIIALVCICLGTSLLLGLTNELTAPLIEQNTADAANAARVVLLPQADSFEEVAITADVENVTAMYKATNGAGYVIEAFGQGYGGRVPVMVAFDENGNIVGVTFMENNETPGLGQKITDPGFATQFAGRTANPMSLSDVDKIASATITTGAGINGINAAIELYNAQVLGEAAAVTPEEINAQLLPGARLTPITLQAENVQPTAWRADDGSYIIYGQHVAERSTVIAAVAISSEGEILNLWLDTSGDSPTHGALLAANQDFINSFIGQSSPASVDVVAGVTGTSNSVMNAVNNALAALPQAKEAA